MSKKTVTVQNIETGLVGEVPEAIALHPILGSKLKVVPFGTKSRVPLGGKHLTTPPAPKPEKPESKKEEDK